MKSLLVLLSLAAGVFLTAFSIYHLHTVLNDTDASSIDPSSMISVSLFPYSILGGVLIWCVSLICLSFSCKKQ